MSSLDNQLPEGWVETTLDEITVKIGSGATPRGGADAYKTEGISLIRSQNILDFNFSYNGLAFIDDDQAKKLSNVTIEENDVLLNITGDSVARVCMVPLKVIPARVNQHVSIIRANKDILNAYYLLYYLLNPSFKIFLLKLASDGATRNALTKSNIEELIIKLPTLKEQKAIAKVLTAFDDKIENLQAQNKTLEQTAQTIFKEWFGKYQIGDELPEGWRVGKLSEIGTIVCGKTPSKSKNDYYGDDIPFVKIPDMHNQVFILETNDNLTFLGANSQRNKMIPKNSIIVSCIATVGLVSLSTQDCQTNQQINSVIPVNKFLREYLYLKLTSLRKFLNDLGSGGTATLNVNTSTFSNIELVIPDNDSLIKFNKIQSPLFEKILSNLKQIQTLTKTRDTLLPKLMSGAIRVNGFKK